MAFEIDNSRSRSDLAWLRENRILSVIDNQCRLTLLGLSALAKTTNIHASRIYGRCNAVLMSIQALVQPPHPPPQPNQRFDAAEIARRLPGDRPQDIQELLIYFYNTDVLLPVPSAGGFWAPEAVTLGSDFINFIGKELDDLVRVLWEERARNARLLQPQCTHPAAKRRARSWTTPTTFARTQGYLPRSGHGPLQAHATIRFR